MTDWEFFAIYGKDAVAIVVEAPVSGHRSWRELSDDLIQTPAGKAAYERAKRELDEALEIECRYGNCVIFVNPDSNAPASRRDLGGWGPVDCPCKAGELDDEMHWTPDGESA